MAVPAAASVRDANRYRPPQISGLAGLLDRQVRERPSARALVVTGERVRLTYGTLATLADDVAARLGGAGLRRGDAVGLIYANTAEFVVGLLGAARAGLVAAPLDPALPESQLSSRIAGLGARAVMSDTAVSGAAVLPVPAWPLRVDVSAAGTATVVLETSTCGDRQGAAAAGELSERGALVLFTAGTTARAKMVPLTHANVAASVQNICATYELGPADATVAVMPFFHGHGLFAALLASLASGGCVLLPSTSPGRRATTTRR
jgi:acyl-CoA synthetase (AMP-forming)/AMP-acid ligase II